MLSVCLSGHTPPAILDQWSFVLSHWKPDRVYLLGGQPDLTTNAFKAAIRIETADALPRDPLVVFSPKSARFFPGKIALPDFKHPSSAVYFFGSNKVHLSEDEMGYRLPDYSVYIPTHDHHEMYDFVAAAVAFYARACAHG